MPRTAGKIPKSPKGKSLSPPAFEPWERRYTRRGYRVIAGVDEVGRGCLAGPVVAAAVVLPPICNLDGVDDSKKLTPQLRERLFPKIINTCFAFGIAMVSVAVIDEKNILQASLLAMRQAVLRLRLVPSLVLVDGKQVIPHLVDMAQATLIDGDARCLSIAAASIVAKVSRDRLMRSFDRDYPEYGFAAHKGYGTALHCAALARHGVTPLHRRSFAPVREQLKGVLDES